MAAEKDREIGSEAKEPEIWVREDLPMSEWVRKYAVSAACLPVITVLCALFLFREVLFTGKSLYGSDFVLQFYPWKKFVFDHLQSQGSLPFWNPYLFSGSPLIPNIQVSLFYPLGFLYYLMPPDIAYGYSTVLHFMLGSGFMYLFMRSLGVHPVGCLFSTIVFMFNGYFMAHLFAGHLSFVQNYIWIPLIFFFLNRFVQRASLCDAIGAGFSLGFQILGGFPQIAFYTILASSLFVLLWWVLTRREKEKVSPFKLGAGWGLFVFLGFALAAVQVLPTYEFTKLSTRGGGIGYTMATYESLHPKELLAFLLPGIFGNPIDGTYWRSQDFWHFWESCGYVGILPLLFLFVRGYDRKFIKVRAYAVILILFSLFLALGKYNPLYPYIYKLPGFNSFRLPAQIIFLYVFSVAVLSGLGLSRILEREWRLTRGFWIFLALSGILLVTVLIGLTFFRLEFFFSLFRNFSEGPVTHVNMSLLWERISHSVHQTCLIFFLSLFLLVLLKRRRISPSIFSFLACGIVFADLYLFGAPFVRTYEFVTSPEKQHLLSQLSQTAVKGRVVTSDGRFGANDGLRHRFPSILGYDPLILKKYVDFVLHSQGYPPNEHVVNLYEISAPQAKLIKLLHARQLVSEGQVEELENEIPYAFLVPNGTVKSEKTILPFMKSDEFDPRKTVVFSKPPKQEHRIGEQNRPFIGSCQVLSHSTEKIRFRISCNQPSYLVMSEVWFPGWVASVDGEDREVICGNYLFRVVPVEEGDHEVILSFISWPFRIGAMVSLATLLCSVWFAVRSRRRDSFNGLPENRSAAA